jgi:acetoin utilization deacetylase AcuC-like enzyme
VNTAVVTSKSLVRHITPQGHPESPQRLLAILQELHDVPNIEWLLPRKAALSELCLAHSREYVALVQREVLAQELEPGIRFLSTGDVTICPDSFEMASLAAGCVITACDAVMKQEVKNAFCVVRPPGHHATHDKGMGFCLFNNVAIGAQYIRSLFGIKRVLIVDWDLHHGNGTQDIFYEDPAVFYFSTHQEGIYPGTGKSSEQGAGEGLGTTLNCPIQPSLRSADEVVRAFQDKLIPALTRFQPEFVFISAGFDAHKDDPLGALELTEAHFVLLTNIVKEIARKWAKERIVSVLEGGYNIAALARSSREHLLALCG